MSLLKLMLAYIIMSAMLLAQGCGSGGSSSNVESGQIDNRPTEGTLTLLLTDGPTSDFDHVYITITEILLLRENGSSEPVFTGEERVDLLGLQNFSEVLTVNDSLPTGSYEKIRLRVNNIELVTDDDYGDVALVTYPKLPANGKIDLNPRGSFDILEGQNTVVTIDIDAEKSIKVVENGSGGYNFRPVVFVDIDTLSAEPERLVRISGTIQKNEIEDTLALCFEQGESIEEINEVCYDIVTDDETVAFNDLPELISLSSIATGSPATITGWLTLPQSSADDAEVIGLHAAVIESGIYSFVSGETQAEVISNTTEIEISDAQGFTPGSTLLIQLLDEARIFDQHGNELVSGDIEEGVQIDTSGILHLSDTRSDRLITPLVFVHAEGDSLQISGTVIDVSSDQMIVSVDGGTASECVNFSEETSIYQIDSSESSPIDIDDIVEDSPVDVYGVSGSSGCIEAETIIIFEEAEEDNVSVEIPHGHLPPPGECRLWYYDLPAGHQPPPADCDVLEEQVTEENFLVRR